MQFTATSSPVARGLWFPRTQFWRFALMFLIPYFHGDDEAERGTVFVGQVLPVHLIREQCLRVHGARGVEAYVVAIHRGCGAPWRQRAWSEPGANFFVKSEKRAPANCVTTLQPSTHLKSIVCSWRGRARISSIVRLFGSSRLPRGMTWMVHGSSSRLSDRP